ncbi:MAG: acetate kinase [Porphyromonas sp.]|uniref:acetate/propionate family kinase n=1 Tax=Porphyromonas sp. TaxID=1924944 RepID=UPI002A812BCE|nr:acetate kinase [Porphyromonas sp.]MDY4246300.1 acetate kinase [Porphyromonas sp.]
MIVLVLNCGSSSVKYSLYDMPEARILASGGIEKLALPDSFIKFKTTDGKKVQIDRPLPEHTVAVEFILEILTKSEYAVLDSVDQIEAVGHRLVHGGEAINKSVLINDEVIEQVKRVSDLAPLHNPPSLKGIDAITKLLPKVQQVAVFDTAFHQTMPAYTYMYALPYEYYEKYGVRRYGFHGTSHRYISHRACEILGKDFDKTRIITCHIGNGASIAAVCNGKVLDTSMGLTPTDGLMMGTRCGSIDPGIVPFIMEHEKMTPSDFSTMVNKKSGVMGISGVSSDMRDVEQAAEAGNERAKLALEMYRYRIKKYIGAYAAAMGGVDVIVFTGGVGENDQTTRESVVSGLEFMGIEFDSAVNRSSRGEEKVLSKPSSRVTVLCVPTDEELMIARDTMDLVK